MDGSLDGWMSEMKFDKILKQTSNHKPNFEGSRKLYKKYIFFISISTYVYI